MSKSRPANQQRSAKRVDADKALKPLEPVDRERCQADIKPAYSPLAIAHPPPRWGRCTNKATWYAREVKPDADGRKGAMSLCDGCKVVCEERRGNEVLFEPFVGWNARFHQLYENPYSVPFEDVERILRDEGADTTSAASFAQLIGSHWGPPKVSP